jgi:hypothetical protein
MLPNQLVPESFRGYPAEAKRLAASHITLLRRLPLSFLPLLLRELILYDWKFPAERREIDRQFPYLRSLSPEQLAKVRTIGRVQAASAVLAARPTASAVPRTRSEARIRMGPPSIELDI